MSDVMQTFPVKRIIEHGPGVKSFYFERIMDALPGQFVNVWLPGVDEKPYSVSALGPDWLEISVKAYGPFSQAMMRLQVDQRVGLRGPFGHGFSFHDRALLIGGGIGIAPLRLLAHELSNRNLRFVSLLGAATDYELIFLEDFEHQSRKCFVTTDDGTRGQKGLVTDDLLKIVEQEKIEFIYAAGPEIMFVKIKELIDPLGIPYEFCLERYMKCGIGICGQCVLDDSGVRVCVEGPVLNQDDLKEVSELGLIHRDASGRRVAKRN